MQKAKSQSQGALLPVGVHNLGSQEAQALDFSREVLWERMSGPMGRKAVKIPVFLVNRDQMDYLYPPERLRCLDPKQVREWARRFREEDEDRPPLWGLDERVWERETVAVGLYISHLDGASKALELGKRATGEAEGLEALQGHQGPAIFLCPERIVSWAEREGISPHLVADKVYYHELGHALMDTGPTPYGERWGRVVEEGLANRVAFRCFKGKEALWVQRLIQEQPAEYQTYLAVEEVLHGISGKLLEEWWDRFRFFVLHRMPHWVFEEWVEAWERWLRWAYRRGIPPHLPVFFPPFLPPDGGSLGAANYQLWREAKRREAFRDPEVREAWARFAEALLLRAFS